MDSTYLELVAGLGIEEVVRRLVGALRMHDCGNRSLSFYLWEVQSRRLMQRMGYPDAVVFAARELEISRRRAQELIATGRMLLELKEVDRAFREGELCWSKVRVLVRVATVETEGSWVERAREVSCRELQALARRAGPGQMPGDGGAEGGLPEVWFRVEGELDAMAFEEWTLARQKLGAELGRALTDAEVMRLLAQMVLSTRPDGSVPGRVAVEESIYKVVVDPERAHVRGDDGSEAVPAEVVEAAASDAAVPPALRRRVLARDGHRCVCCGRKGYLQIHHVVWLSRGGRTELSNLTAVCSHCHALVHAGELVVEGQGLGVRSAREVPRHRPGLAMSLEGTQALRPGDSTAAEGREPPLTLDSIPAMVSARWWREHEDQFEWRKDGSVRLKSDRSRARACR